jgi:uncharacterized membrane protein YphA (DoxX/SURF4 family)
MRVAGAGHAVFAATMILVGALALATGNFAPVWQPLPAWAPLRQPLTNLVALLSLACGAGMLWPRTATPATLVLSVCLLLWWLLFRVPVVLHAPLVEVSWEGCAETAVILAAAWLLHAQCSLQARGPWTGNGAVRGARALYALALIPFGLAHFVYVKETAALVPHWLPAHQLWAYLTGAAYLAAGAALLSGVWAPLAARLACLQMGLFTLLVWVPVVAHGRGTAADWSETILSLALTASGWVVSDSYAAGTALRVRVLARHRA